MKKTIILDMAAGNNTKNDPEIISQMIQAAYRLQQKTDKQIIIKFQLFEKIKDLIPLKKELFTYAYYEAQRYNMLVTASVFDTAALQFLLSYDTPLIKIACRDHLYILIDLIPNDIPVCISVDDQNKIKILEEKYYPHKIIPLCCVPKYPAEAHEYLSIFWERIGIGLSDHTRDLELYKNYKPEIWERHFILDKNECLDPFGCDFMSTEKELEEIL